MTGRFDQLHKKDFKKKEKDKIILSSNRCLFLIHNSYSHTSFGVASYHFLLLYICQ